MTRIPVTISFVTIAVNVVLNVVLMGPLQHRGLALATSIASVLNFVLLFEVLRRKIGPMGGRILLRSSVKITFAAALAAGAGYLAAHGLELAIGMQSLLERALVVAAGFATATVIYAAGAITLRIEESAPLWALVRRLTRR
jgi:putative peptidoglycan lipid II flippase